MTTKKSASGPVAELTAVGFTEYEARAYVALLQHGELTGYAWAQASGIPRANIYAVAEKLADRGAVQRCHGSAGKAWVALDPERVLGSIGAQQRLALGHAQQALAKVVRVPTPDMVFTLHGDELLVRARQLAATARKELLVAIQVPEAGVLAAPLTQARERGVAVTTLCLDACEQPCRGCQGDVYRFALAPEDGSRWLVMAVDGEQALAGQLWPQNVQGIVTSQPLVVELASAYVRQSLVLATLKNELVGRELGAFSESARNLFATLFPRGQSPATTRH